MDMTGWLQSIILLLCLAVILAKDYYEILGVERNASEKEIKRKFRQLGLKFLRFDHIQKKRHDLHFV